MTRISIADLSDVEEISRVVIESKIRSLRTGCDVRALYSEAELDYEWQVKRLTGYISGTTSPQKALPERTVLKACVENRCVGVLAGHRTTRHDMDAEIQTFYVLSESQRGGIGSLLLSQWIDWALAQGAKSLCVGVSPLNEYKMFYLKFGGREINPHWVGWDDMPRLKGSLERSLSR